MRSLPGGALAGPRRRARFLSCRLQQTAAHHALLPTLHADTAGAADAARRCEVAAWGTGRRRETTREGGAGTRQSPRLPGQGQKEEDRHQASGMMWAAVAGEGTEKLLHT